LDYLCIDVLTAPPLPSSTFPLQALEHGAPRALLPQSRRHRSRLRSLPRLARGAQRGGVGQHPPPRKPELPVPIPSVPVPGIPYPGIPVPGIPVPGVPVPVPVPVTDVVVPGVPVPVPGPGPGETLGGEQSGEEPSGDRLLPVL
jgi:hypothetical protein